MALAALLLGIGTALGAVASHLLEGSLGADALHAFETAVDYQLIHAVGLFALAAYGALHPRLRLLGLAAMLVTLGILLFCGGVYASSLDGPRWLARLAPSGGISLILGWIVAAVTLVADLVADRGD